MKMETGDGMKRQSKIAFEMNMSVRQMKVCAFVFFPMNSHIWGCMRQVWQQLYSHSLFHRFKCWQTLAYIESRQKQRNSQSSTQFFELRLRHVPKIIFFTYQRTAQLRTPSVLLKTKNWKLFDMQEGLLSNLRVDHFCYSLGSTPKSTPKVIYPVTLNYTSYYYSVLFVFYSFEIQLTYSTV